ncbi:MAG TPA: peptide chain release factor N(5)-glutamine methyltransferase [Chromatiales bacterium]|nr:peptide chain release factor N(5)-glutamine methyltransferase [Thiotrichales bacterium]HIP69144.1 peptide chain release factor N(5)-glutamine methyltransferase [Chromatiales bacterium]
MTSIKTALQSAAGQLQNISEENKLEAEILLMFALQKPRSFLHAWPEKELDETQFKKYQHLVSRRIKGEPVAYIVGEKEFWSLPLKVTPDVLIPRPETELLVELALKFLPEKKHFKVADLGTGAGAIALALASERPDWKITATDRSKAALEVAEKNAAFLKIKNIRFLSGQWCTAFKENDYDLIISNPPYVAENDPYLQQGGLPFEPRQALASGEEGLDDIKIIIQQVKKYLIPGGWLMLEHGYDQAEAVGVLLNKAGYESIQCHADLAGLPRATVAAVTETCIFPRK